jgi:tight adherence protein C
MQRLVRRCPLAGMAVLVAALERAERHGAPLADTLAAQAREAREARARHLREHAAKAAPKIQLVVALLLVPSVMLLVAAALLASMR